jgi:5'-nucleotidase/UDP-sugar diphosphatase
MLAITRMRTTAAAIFAAGSIPLLITGIGLLSSFAAGCGSSAEGETVTQVCPTGQTCQTRLTLLHTADIHSRLFPYNLDITQIDSTLGLGQINTIANVGGVARLSYVLGRERARADRVLHLDSGDVFEGAPIFNFFNGEPEVRSLSLLGTDAATIGNHEFDDGALNVTTQFQKWAEFPALVSNYDYNDVGNPASPNLSSITSPFTVFNEEGLKIAVIGMGNLSSLGSLFSQPNKLAVTPLNTIDTAQFYIDLIRPYVDVVIMLSHLGLEDDEDMVRGTTGIDVVLGGHNHIVINPPQQLRDCNVDPNVPGYIWASNPNEPLDPSHPIYDPLDVNHQHPNEFPRKCKPRNVLICHSGAFAKYLGRLDLILSNDKDDITAAEGFASNADYDPNNGFEVISSDYTAFPINDQVPEDAQVVQMLEPYQRVLDRAADLDILVGFSPTGAKRTAPQGGDSPLGNLISTAMWLRLGVQTDFSLTNTTGIRTDLDPGPITIEEMYNIFPFNNTITKMQLSGLEVQEMFDFVARRSSSRSCVSQAQIAGSRVVLNCAGCARPGAATPCTVDNDCGIGSDGCNLATHLCDIPACAEQIYIGVSSTTCQTDADCPLDANGKALQGACDTQITHKCASPIAPTNLYELATSNYLAGGGSGFRVLQRNTTQFDTLIEQRDALIDYLRQGKPCGYKTNADGTPFFNTAEGLKACTSDNDCSTEGDFVCACAGHVKAQTTAGTPSCQSSSNCDPSQGRCVRRDCRDQVATFHNGECASSPVLLACESDLDACSLAGEECKLLSCVDQSEGNFTDNRLDMLGR